MYQEQEDQKYIIMRFFFFLQITNCKQRLQPSMHVDKTIEVQTSKKRNKMYEKQCRSLRLVNK